MKIGQLVYAKRKIGKNGISIKTKGIIVSFSNIITINDKLRAMIKFSDDKNDFHWFPIDELEIAL